MPPSRSRKIFAQAPFDDAQADVILQSSDQVHFQVFKNILSLASPIFADTFSFPSPPSKTPDDEVQVVTLSEDSTALEVALRHIYPVQTTPSEAEKLRYASILAEFARKYQVESLNRFIRGYLTDSIEFDPVGVYAIAFTY
jgi:BTB/POZ domain